MYTNDFDWQMLFSSPLLALVFTCINTDHYLIILLNFVYNLVSTNVLTFTCKIIQTYHRSDLFLLRHVITQTFIITHIFYHFDLLSLKSV